MPKRNDKFAESGPKAPGTFLGDGRFNPDGFEAERGPTDRLIRAMVAERRAGKLSPGRAANFIEAANAGTAFPCREQWSQAVGWPMCQTSTEAEEAVKRCGRGVDGHWCGDIWRKGHEKDCHDERHKVRLRPEQAAELLAQTMKAIGHVPSVTVYEEDP